MTGLKLENFGAGASAAAPAPTVAPAADRYDEGYNAGWDDAMAQIEADHGRLSEKLAERLGEIGQNRAAAQGALLAALEPALRDVFDLILPRTVDASFLPAVLEEVTETLARTSDHLTLLVCPEEAVPLMRLLDRAGIDGARVTVTSEPALAMSQALLRWTGEERRIDLGHVLAGLDDALETFFDTMTRAEDALEAKDTQNA